MAENEYRENFALTPVEQPPNAEEIVLPGSHSDIGGGYRDGMPERREIDIDYDSIKNLEALKKKLVEEGFFYDFDLSLEGRKLNKNPLNVVRFHLLRSYRKRINASYNKVPLRVMVNKGDLLLGGKGKMFIEKSIAYHSEINKEDPVRLRRVKEIFSKLFEGMLGLWQEEGKNGNSEAAAKTRKNELIRFIHSCIGMVRMGTIASIKPSDNEVLYVCYERVMNHVFKSGPPLGVRSGAEIVSAIGDGLLSEEGIRSKKEYILNELIVQTAYRVFRRRFLHWSSSYEGKGWDGNMLLMVNVPTGGGEPSKNNANFYQRQIFRG